MTLAFGPVRLLALLCVGGACHLLSASLGWPAGVSPLDAQQTLSDTLARADSLAAAIPLEEISVRVGRGELSLADAPFSVTGLRWNPVARGERGVSLEELLRAVPGALAQNRRNFSLGDRLSIRGAGGRAQFGVRGVRVLLDGFPLTLADGQSVLTLLDVADLERVELIRGPVGALYGNASGGILSLATRAPPRGPLGLTARLLAGPYGTLDTRLRAGGTVGRSAYAASLSRHETTGFRAHARAEEYRARIHYRRHISARTSLRGLFGLFHTPFSENPSSLSREDARLRPRFTRPFIIAQGAGERATQGLGGLGLETPVGPVGTLRATAWGSWRTLWNPIPGRIIRVNRGSGGLRLEASRALGTRPAPALGWTFGVDLESQRDRRREAENLGAPAPGRPATEGATLLDQREAVTGIGPFLRAELRPAPRWVLTLAGRIDRYRFAATDFHLVDGDDGGGRTLSKLSPMVGLAYRVDPGVTLYGSFATAFQTPTAGELSNRPDGAGGFDPTLGPERIRSFEVGVRGRLRGGGLAFHAAAYRATAEGALVPFQSPDEETFFQNAGSADRTGVELSAVWRPIASLETRLAYAGQRFRFDEFRTEEGDFSGRREPGLPDHTLFVGAAARLPAGIRAEAQFRWMDAFPVNDANTDFNGSARVVDLRFHARPAGGRIQPYVGIDNLFGERYNGSVVPNAFGGRYYEPAPGREVYGGISLLLGVR